MKDCLKNIQGNGIGRGTNFLYAIDSCQEQEDSRNSIVDMIQVFEFSVYVFLDSLMSLSLYNFVCFYKI